MSIFSEFFLPKLNEISITFKKEVDDDIKAAFDCFEEFEECLRQNRARVKTQKDKNAKTTLQSINEDEDESNKLSKQDPIRRRSSKKSSNSSQSSNENNEEQRASMKRSKNEVDGILSPEQDKRQKRNASVKAQSIISRQVNVNLTAKMRRENSIDKADKNHSRQSSRSRQRKDDEKENLEPSLVQIKQEKISLQPEMEPMDLEPAPINLEVKQEVVGDDIAMPPPSAPVPKPRKGVPKEKPSSEKQSEENGEEQTSRRSRRSTRNRKQTELMAPPPAPPSRATRGSSRPPEQEAPPEPRPKRTRAKKQASEPPATADDTTTHPSESVPASPTEKPRPKRTRRAQKAAEKEQAEIVEPTPPSAEVIAPKDERMSQLEMSPIILQKEVQPKYKKGKTNPNIDSTKTKMAEKELAKTKIAEKEMAETAAKEAENAEKYLTKTKIAEKELAETAEKQAKNAEKYFAKTAEDLAKSNGIDQVDLVLDETKIITKAGEMDQTVVLPNGVYNHAPVSPTNVRNMNETVVLEICNRETMVLDKQKNTIMDATVIIDKGPKAMNMTDDNSLLTDDSEVTVTPPKGIPLAQPTSAVKEKVQQFEEMASRVTRTKTRAMAKKEEPRQQEEPESQHTPPDKISKVVLSTDTLAKMNSLIFNGKAPQTSVSASKPRAVPAKPLLSASSSKLSAIMKAREAHEESTKREDARKKKEAMLEAKREQQKRKREEKMAAAAATRSAAERERRAALEAAARERHEKQAHLDLGKVERRREAERKKLELARKVAETEERRKAEETARRQHLEEEQRRAAELRRKQLEEQEAMKREAAKMDKEIEQKQREYIEKQKKQRLGDKLHTPFKSPGKPQYARMDPVHMEDGFQYLISDEDAEEVARPIPEWSSYKSRKQKLTVQAQLRVALVACWFGVREHTPDLRELFPGIERARTKRTSSAVWRTPPPHPHHPPPHTHHPPPHTHHPRARDTAAVIRTTPFGDFGAK